MGGRVTSGNAARRASEFGASALGQGLNTLRLTEIAVSKAPNDGEQDQSQHDREEDRAEAAKPVGEKEEHTIRKHPDWQMFPAADERDVATVPVARFIREIAMPL